MFKAYLVYFLLQIWDQPFLLRSTGPSHWKWRVFAVEAVWHSNNATVFPRWSYRGNLARLRTSVMCTGTFPQWSFFLFFHHPLFYFSLACSVDSLVEKCRVQLSCSVWARSWAFCFVNSQKAHLAELCVRTEAGVSLEAGLV